MHVSGFSLSEAKSSKTSATICFVVISFEHNKFRIAGILEADESTGEFKRPFRTRQVYSSSKEIKPEALLKKWKEVDTLDWSEMAVSQETKERAGKALFVLLGGV